MTRKPQPNNVKPKTPDAVSDATVRTLRNYRMDIYHRIPDFGVNISWTRIWISALACISFTEHCTLVFVT